MIDYVYISMVKIDNIEKLIKKYKELWKAIANTEIATTAYPEDYDVIDTDYDGYDYSDEQKLYRLFGINGNHEFIALYVPKEYDERADECPVLLVDPETINDNNQIVGSTDTLGNIKSYLHNIIEEYMQTGPSDPQIIRLCNEVLLKINKYSNNLLDLPYQLRPYDY